VKLYQTPPPDTHVICVDEMGPTAAKTYLAARWNEKRPSVEADYGRRGKVWTFGAFEPGSGHAITWCADGRTSANFLTFLDQIVMTWPERNIILILDNLSTHKTLNVLLWALVHPHVRFLFQPTYAPWLNLIEPWWKTLRSLALKGCSFLDADQIVHAIQMATDYWNQHRHPYHWRKAA
jgi:transposase